VWGERPHRAEVAPVEREHRISPVLGRQRHIDRVGQVQVEACVLLLDQAGRVQDLQTCFGDLKAQLPGLGEDEVDNGGSGPGSETGLGQVINLSEHQRRDDHGACFPQDSLASCGLARVAVRCSNDP
jgi:hypothetical protein